MSDAIGYLQLVLGYLAIPLVLMFSIGLTMVLADGLISLFNPFRR